MLVDPTFIPFTEEQKTRWREIAIQEKLEGVECELRHPKRLARGVYLSHEILDQQVFEEFSDDVEEWQDWKVRNSLSILDKIKLDDAHKKKMNKLYSEKYKKGPYRPLSSLGGCYGMSDSYEQILERFPHLVDDAIPRFMAVRPVFREHQPSNGGFRYHKSGQYIGKQNPRHEYLYDDTHIDYILMFHIYRIKDMISN